MIDFQELAAYEIEFKLIEKNEYNILLFRKLDENYLTSLKYKFSLTNKVLNESEKKKITELVIRRVHFEDYTFENILTLAKHIDDVYNKEIINKIGQ